MKLKNLEARNRDPASVEVRRKKMMAFSPRVIVVSMCEFNWACRRLVMDSMLSFWSRKHGRV